MQNAAVAESIPGAGSHWTEAAGLEPGSGPVFEQNTAHVALAVLLVCCWCVGWGLGQGGESDTWILVCSLLETSFVLNFISFGAKRTNLIFNFFSCFLKPSFFCFVFF